MQEKVKNRTPDYGCEGKGKYSKGKAESVRKAVMKKRNRKIRIYECKCGYWHLTSEIGKL